MLKAAALCSPFGELIAGQHLMSSQGIIVRRAYIVYGAARRGAQASMAEFPVCSYKSSIFARGTKRGASVAAAGERCWKWKEGCCGKG